MKIIIIGASKGIGRELYKLFCQHGYDVTATYCFTRVDDVHYVYLDNTDVIAVQGFADSFKGENVVLINCAGISYNAFAHKSDLIMWKRVIDVNVCGTFNVIRAFLPYMRKKEWGRIIVFSSVVTKYPTPGVSAYVASKAALGGLVKTLSCENASKHVTVNALNLGYTDAGMGVNDVPAEYRDKMMSLIPEKRFCTPDEIFNTIEYLIKTEYVNGASLDINGGLV